MTVPDPEVLKREAAVAAAALAGDGMALGLGTGSTVAHLLPALAARGLQRLRCVATSVTTEVDARTLGLPVEAFAALERLDLAIDGADQVAHDGWLVKGGGGAHVREKIVAAAATRFVVIVDERKVVDALRAPVPLEVLPFGLAATLAEVSQLGGDAVVRAGAPPSPDGNVIVDYLGVIGDPAALATALDAVAGVVGHGLFAPALVSDVVVAGAGGVRWMDLPTPRRA